MTPTELAYLSVTEASNGLRRKEFSPLELARACLERIEAIDGKLHSFITINADMALEQARIAEQELHAGINKGPLHGIPIARLCENWDVSKVNTWLFEGRATKSVSLYLEMVFPIKICS